MSILTRNDGTQFVVHTYRELLRNKKKSLLNQQIRHLADQHGQHVQLYKKKHGEYEAVFSRESGYLLGESVKQFFSSSNNLVFCESIANSQKILLIIIKSGSVFLDAIIPKEQLKTELLPLMAEKTAFEIITHGDIPLYKKPPETNDEDNDAVIFPADITTSFDTLDRPLLPRLKTLNTFKLQPLHNALKSQRLYVNPYRNIIAAGAVIVCAILFIIAKHSIDTRPVVSTVIPKNPYHDYNQALMTPSPSQQIATILGTITALYTVPGWQIEKAQLQGHQLSLSLTPSNGNIETLIDWAKKNKFSISFQQNVAKLTKALSLQPRPQPAIIFPIEQAFELLADKINTVMEGKNITVNANVVHQATTEKTLNINLHNTSPQELELLSNALSQLPVTTNRITLDIAADTLINGSIQLSIWGK